MGLVDVNDYAFAENPLGFRARTVRAITTAQQRIAELRLADTVGIDFHKTGYTPYISSLLLARDGHDFELLARQRETMPYLYQSGEHHPGMFTLETSRSGFGPMAALANLLLLGKTGYQALLGHAVEMAETLRELIEAQPQVTVLNHQNVGPVTLFRAYPNDVDLETVTACELSDPDYRERVTAYNDYNRRIFARIHAEALLGRGVALSLTDCYRRSVTGQPISALKSYVLSPFSDAGRMASIMRHVWSARDAVNAEWPPHG